jgi:hypothetical protein
MKQRKDYRQLLQILTVFLIVILPIKYEPQGASLRGLKLSAPTPSTFFSFAFSQQAEKNSETVSEIACKRKFNTCRDLLVKSAQRMEECQVILNECKKECPTDYVPWGISSILLLLLILI